MVGVEVVVEVAAVVQVAVAASSFWVAAISGAQKVKDVEDCLKNTAARSLKIDSRPPCVALS